MGSVPIHMPKLLGISALIELLGILAMMLINFDYKWLFLLSGLIYFIVIFARYRNPNARHTYEKDTKTNMTNLRKVDKFIKSRKNLSNPIMQGANNKRVDGIISTKRIIAPSTSQNTNSE